MAAGLQPGALVFHPGIGKTATTAIQEAGLALPTRDAGEACFCPFGVVGGAHNAFASNHPLFEAAAFDKALSSCIQFARSRRAPTVVSSEFLIRDDPKRVGEMLHRVLAAGLPVQAVFAVRGYAGFLVSAYMQALKVRWGMREHETLEDFARRELPLVRYPTLIDRWARYLGDENIFLLDYDRHRDRFVPLFFTFLGLPEIGARAAGSEVNASLPVTAAEVLWQFDRVSSDAAAREKLVGLLMNVSYRDGAAAPFLERVRKVVGDAYEQDRDRLAARYTWVEP